MKQWKEYAGYRNAMKETGDARTFLLNRFLSRTLPPHLYSDSLRKEQITKILGSKTKLRYKKSDTYIKNLEITNKRSKSRRSESCHSDINWVLGQIDCNTFSGVISSPSTHFNSKTGYYQSTIWGRTYLAHRLIWMAHNKTFIPDGLEINHIDNDKSNNRIDNLELVSHKENLKKYHTGTWGILKKTKYLTRVWDICSFYYSQPYHQKIRNTMLKYDVSAPALNCWIHIFPAHCFKTKDADFWINKSLKSLYSKEK